MLRPGVQVPLEEIILTVLIYVNLIKQGAFDIQLKDLAT